MRNLILDGGPIQAAFETGQDSTVLTLLNTPTETVIVNSQVDINIIVNAESESFAGDFIRSLNTQITALNNSVVEEDKRLAAILEVYRTQLAGEGINLTNNKVRNKITDALQAQGWPGGKRNRILNLGYVMASKPQVLFGRAAEQADLDALRATLIVEGINRVVATGMNESVNPAIAAGDRVAVAAALHALADSVGAG